MNIRKGIKDVWWRPYMVLGAKFSENDIPSCPTTATEMPALILTYKEAKELYRKEMREHNKDFMSLAYVCFYADDCDFDSFKGIWFRSNHAYKVNTGTDINGFAQNLANKLNVTVYAPTNIVWAYPSGRHIVAPRLSNDPSSPLYKYPDERKSKRGKFIPFTPGGNKNGR